MKYLKSFEDIANAGTAGMGSVVNSQPGYLPGTTGTSGSGDVTFTLANGKKKKRRKLGNPSEVSDARFLAPVKLNKVKY